MDMCTGKIGTLYLPWIIVLELGLGGQGEKPVKTGIEFAEAIGFDSRKALTGTAVEYTLNELLEWESLDGSLGEETESLEDVFDDPWAWP